jgi:hypothetical protein
MRLAQEKEEKERVAQEEDIRRKEREQVGMKGVLYYLLFINNILIYSVYLSFTPYPALGLMTTIF